MIRGVERRTIFCCDSDFEDFLARFALLVRELGFVVLAWCLIRNHAHFVLKTGAFPLAVFMKRLNSRHALRFNRLNDRVGHLFQDRYKAVRIEDDGGLARCAAYVLGNALRHRIVLPERPEDYPWSGYGALVGRRPAREFESVDVVAAALGVERGQVPGFVRREAAQPIGAGAALEPDQIDELRRLIRATCARHGVDSRALATSALAARAARAEICARAADSLDLSISEVAKHVRISYGAARRLSTLSRPT
jgi:REP element-mobilizing transposase RayT